jgi:hypothetical protein
MDGGLEKPLRQQPRRHAQHRTGLGKPLVERVYRSAMLGCCRQMQSIAGAKP